MDGSANTVGNLATGRSAKRRHSTMEDSHRSTSPSGLAASTSHHSQYDSHYANEQPSRRPRLEPPQPPPLPFGYGFDYRRPILSTSTPQPTRSPGGFDMDGQLETIDLTRESLALPRISQHTTTTTSASTQTSPQRASGLPRFSRDDIIDISSGDEAESQPRQRRRPRAEQRPPTLENILQEPDSGNVSDEAEIYMLADPDEDDSLFLPDDSSASFSTMANGLATSRSRRNRSQQSSIPPHAHIVDLTDDDVEFIESRLRAGANSHEPTFSRGVQTRGGDDGDLITYTVSRLSEVIRNSLGHANRLLPRIAAHYNASEETRRHHAARAQFPPRQFDGRLTAAMNVLHNAIPTSMTGGATASNLPGQMDYTWTAFDIGQSSEPRERAAEYVPPPPLPAGFTGSPTVEEPVVCPNCGDELAQGESEIKRQVWVIKACGHAYCGGCMVAKLSQPLRTKSSRRDKEREQPDSSPPLLKSCVIEGCRKPVSKSTVLHVYLSE